VVEWLDKLTMNFLISLIYAPLVVLSLKYFDIKFVSIFIFIFSLIWFAILFNKNKKETIFPIVYLLIAIFAFFMQDFILLKSTPVVISSLVTIIFLLSYLRKKSILLYFIDKFSKKIIPSQEKEYIHKSTLFWVIISFVNTLIHLKIFFGNNIEFWIYYSSFGWYAIFIIAGIVQFLHRKFIFLKRVYD